MCEIPKNKNFNNILSKIDTVGYLTILAYSGKDGIKHYWKCKCRCGNFVRIETFQLIYGKTKSCGCLSKELSRERLLTHGQTNSPEFSVWTGIKKRCYEQNNPSYKDYGGRGITVCERWINSFENFFEDMGERPGPKYSIDRIDVNGNYCLENCRWATSTEQANNRRNTLYIEYEGQKQTLSQLAEKLNIDIHVLYKRVDAGWSNDDIINKPVKTLNSTFNYHGKDLTMMELSIETGISYSTIRRRFSLGWVLEKVISTPIIIRDTQEIEFNGESLILSEWAKRFDLPLNTLRFRMDAGWGIEKTLLTPINSKKQHSKLEKFGLTPTEKTDTIEDQDGTVPDGN